MTSFLAMDAKLGEHPSGRHGGASRRTLLALLLAGAALQLLLALWWVRPGPLSLDEVIYQWMTQDLAAGRPLVLENGYEARPSAELAPFYVRTDGGRLTAQYPYGQSFLGVPFYALLRLRGLFVLNALAFVAALALTWHIGRRLLRDGRAALAGAGILLGGSYAWEYSMAAWPHATALALQLGAFALALEAWPGGEDRGGPDRVGTRAVRHAVLAGLLGGLAAAFRLDALFFVAALGLPYLVASPLRLRELAALALGTLPGLAFLSATNWVRWGNPSPVSYGRLGGVAELARYVPVVAAGLLGLAALIACTRPGARAELAARRRVLPLAAAAIVALVLIVTPARELALRLLQGLWVLGVDLRGQPANYAGGLRVESFALIYEGGIKKALLQSCPWLPVAALPLLARTGDPARRRALLLLAMVPAVLVPAYAVFVWHGGMALNLRYFLPALPFLALLAGASLVALGENREARGVALVAAAAALVLYLVAVAPLPVDDPDRRALWVLDVPMVLGAVGAALVAVLAARSWRPRGSARGAASALLAVTAAAIVWAGLLGYEYDATWSREVRTANLLRSVAVADQVPADAVLFGIVPDWYGTVKHLRPDVTVAYPRQDAYADFNALARYWLAEGRPVFGVLQPQDWSYMRGHGMLDGLEMRVAARGTPYPLMELRTAR